MSFWSPINSFTFKLQKVVFKLYMLYLIMSKVLKVKYKYIFLMWRNKINNLLAININGGNKHSKTWIFKVQLFWTNKTIYCLL